MKTALAIIGVASITGLCGLTVWAAGQARKYAEEMGWQFKL